VDCVLHDEICSQGYLGSGVGTQIDIWLNIPEPSADDLTYMIGAEPSRHGHFRRESEASIPPERRGCCLGLDCGTQGFVKEMSRKNGGFLLGLREAASKPVARRREGGDSYDLSHPEPTSTFIAVILSGWSDDHGPDNRLSIADFSPTYCACSPSFGLLLPK